MSDSPVPAPAPTRAKFKCNSVTNMVDSKSIELVPVTTGSEENYQFFKWTPSGKIELYCLNENVQFTPGQEYYIDFTPAT